MSWSSACIIPADSTPEQVEALLLDATVHSGTEAPEETRAQVLVAKKGAKQWIFSGAFGSLTGPGTATGFMVNLSGHANREHAPREGWANDYVAVSVRQAAAEKP